MQWIEKIISNSESKHLIKKIVAISNLGVMISIYRYHDLKWAFDLKSGYSEYLFSSEEYSSECSEQIIRNIAEQKYFELCLEELKNNNRCIQCANCVIA